MTRRPAQHGSISTLGLDRKSDRERANPGSSLDDSAGPAWTKVVACLQILCAAQSSQVKTKSRVRHRSRTAHANYMKYSKYNLRPSLKFNPRPRNRGVKPLPTRIRPDRHPSTCLPLQSIFTPLPSLSPCAVQYSPPWIGLLSSPPKVSLYSSRSPPLGRCHHPYEHEHMFHNHLTVSSHSATTTIKPSFHLHMANQPRPRLTSR